MAKRLNYYCEQCNIYDDSQNGLRKKYQLHIFPLHNYNKEIQNIINNQKYAVALVLNMRKRCC